ncbi:uncharacterized protein LOC129219090 [Uloborus diversus]|uniref:uncharacterized protein LOC129219090 n=1 Tax=Uloborus diversus TaxID=327109 RepID=UPI00240A15A6|nr:uncharacterized protein LOC129219090 [Uloborus diversus]
MALPLMFRRRSMEKNWQESEQEHVGDAESEEGAQDLFELLERLQNSRLDDQRCVLPSSLQLPAAVFPVADSNQYNGQQCDQYSTQVTRRDITSHLTFGSFWILGIS